MLRFGRIEVGDGAPLGCARCSMPQTPSYRPAADVARAVVQLAEDWHDPPGPNVILTGPEPFGHPELPMLIAAAVSAGFERIGIETDGGALSLRENADGIIDAGVRHVHLRVLSTDEWRGAELTARPNLVSAARRGVAAYRSAAEAAAVVAVVTAVVPVCEHNLDTLPVMVADIAAWGVDAVRLVGAGQLPGRAEAIVAAACDTGMVNRLWVETDGLVPLPALHALHAVPDGGSDD